MEWLPGTVLLKTDNRRPETAALIDFLVAHAGLWIIGRPTDLIRVPLGQLKAMLRQQARLMAMDDDRAVTCEVFRPLLPIPGLVMDELPTQNAGHGADHIEADF